MMQVCRQITDNMFVTLFSTYNKFLQVHKNIQYVFS